MNEDSSVNLLIKREDSGNSIELKRTQSLNNLLVKNNSEAPISQQGPVPANTVSKDREQTNFSNIFNTRTRRFSASYTNNTGLLNLSPGSPCLAPRVSQLRQEECADVSNLRELNHEREIHSALQISQSCDDLTLITENWSVKNQDDFSNPLHVILPVTSSSSASPSPTRRHSTRLANTTGVMSPSPTRRTSFQTRRSMSPIAIRPSPLSSIKRKFDMIDDSMSGSQPFKKIFTESRSSSPIYQIPLSPVNICPSPDSSTYSDCNNGRLTPKLFVPKIWSNLNTNSLSSTSSPLSTFSIENDSSPSSVTQHTLMELGSSEDAVQSEASSSNENSNLKSKIVESLSVEMDGVTSSQTDKSDNENDKSLAPP